MRYVQARIDTLEFLRLKDYAKRNKLSLGYIITEAIRKWLDEQIKREEVGKIIVSAIDKATTKN
jgi:hypothetical protein